MPSTVGFFFVRSPVHVVLSALRQSFPESCHKRPMVVRATSTPTFRLSISSYLPCPVLLIHSLSGRARVWTLRLFQETQEAPQLDVLLIF